MLRVASCYDVLERKGSSAHPQAAHILIYSVQTLSPHSRADSEHRRPGSRPEDSSSWASVYPLAPKKLGEKRKSWTTRATPPHNKPWSLTEGKQISDSRPEDSSSWPVSIHWHQKSWLRKENPDPPLPIINHDPLQKGSRYAYLTLYQRTLLAGPVSIHWHQKSWLRKENPDPPLPIINHISTTSLDTLALDASFSVRCHRNGFPRSRSPLKLKFINCVELVDRKYVANKA